MNCHHSFVAFVCVLMVCFGFGGVCASCAPVLACALVSLRYRARTPHASSTAAGDVHPRPRHVNDLSNSDFHFPQPKETLRGTERKGPRGRSPSSPRRAGIFSLAGILQDPVGRGGSAEQGLQDGAREGFALLWRGDVRLGWWDPVKSDRGSKKKKKRKKERKQHGKKEKG